MKKLQLIGRRKRLLKTETPVYPANHFLSLPNELIFHILDSLATKDHLSLLLVCQQLYKLILTFLYDNVTIRNYAQISKLSKTISKNAKLARMVQQLILINPIPYIQNDSTKDINIGGYSVRMNNSDQEINYIKDLLAIVKHCGGPVSIELREISPKFQIDSAYSSLKLNNHLHIARLALSSQSGWNIPLRPNLLWTFGVIDELCLRNIVIDSWSLNKSKFLTLIDSSNRIVAPSNLRRKNSIINDELEYLESYSHHSSTLSLVLESCTFTVDVSRLANYFSHVKTLKLLNLRSINDLAVMVSFRNLDHLVLDFNSKVFHNHLTNSVENFLNLYDRFDVFFQSLSTSSTSINKMTLLNVDFLKSKYIPTNPFNDKELAKNLLKFFTTLARIRIIELHLSSNLICKKCGSSSIEELPKSKSEWAGIFGPFIHSQNKNTIQVYDSNKSIVYEHINY